MPLKDKKKYNEYMKHYRRNQRANNFVKDNKIDCSYLNGKVYQIRCLTTNKIYIGSTKNTLKRRLHEHKNDPCSSYQIIKNDNYVIELIEEYKCDTRQSLHIREQFYIAHRNCINANKSIHIFLNSLPQVNREIFMFHYQNEAKNKWELNMKLVLNQFKQRVILPRHIYEFKRVLKQMLLVHFKRSFIIKRNRTDLIVQSWSSS